MGPKTPIKLSARDQEKLEAFTAGQKRKSVIPVGATVNKKKADPSGASSKPSSIALVNPSSQYDNAVVASYKSDDAGQAAGAGQAVGSAKKKGTFNHDNQPEEKIFRFENVHDEAINFIAYIKKTWTDDQKAWLVISQPAEDDDLVEGVHFVVMKDNFRKLANHFAKKFAEKHDLDLQWLKEDWDMVDVADMLEEIWLEEWENFNFDQPCTYCGKEPTDDMLTHFCEFEKLTDAGVVNDKCDVGFCKSCGTEKNDLWFCRKHSNATDIQTTLECINQREEAEAFRNEQVTKSMERELFKKYHEKMENDPVMFVTGRKVSSAKNMAKLLGLKKPKPEYSDAEYRAVLCVEMDENDRPTLVERKVKGEIPTMMDQEYDDESSEEDEDFELDPDDEKSAEESSEESSEASSEASSEESSLDDSSDDSSDDEESDGIALNSESSSDSDEESDD